MDTGQLRLDPAAAKLLGNAVTDLARLIDPVIGECVVCHQALGSGPVSLAIHECTDGSTATQVLPGHAACQPASYAQHPAGYAPSAPAPTYQVTSYLARMDGGRQVPAVLLNPSVDVQHGWVREGAWHGDWEGFADMLGVSMQRDLDRLAVGKPMWGAELTAGTLTLKAPTDVYRMSVGSEYAQVLKAGRRVLVFMTDVVLPMEHEGRTVVDGRQFPAAATAGRLFVTWAGLGASAESRPYPQRSTAAAAIPIPAGGKVLQSTGQAEKLLADISVNVRAAWSDHPAVRLGPIITPGFDEPRLPVLLMEPPQAVNVSHAQQPGLVRELRCDAVIGAGLERALPTAATVLSQARDWHVTGTGYAVDLVAPTGEVTAHGEIRKWPPGWLTAAETVGHVLVVYGSEVGVRAPKGRPYNDADRHEEFTRSRSAGRVAWGLVKWSRG